MSTQLNGTSWETDAVIRFEPNAKSVSDNADQLDKAGQTILQLLHRAADVAEDNSRHALEMAQALSQQLRAAEERIAKLETEIEPTEIGPIEPSNGCTEFTLRLKIDFGSGLTTAIIDDAPHRRHSQVATGLWHSEMIYE